MTLIVGVDTSFDKMSDWKAIWEKAEEVNNTKAYITNNKIFHRILNGRYTSNYTL
jgi:hypothetical protein